jgi:hypothetical protein
MTRVPAVALVLSALVSAIGCSERQTATFPGLVGAYYGDANLADLKYAEVLAQLDPVWTEDTGHGSNWAGRWQGYLKSPGEGQLSFFLTATMPTEVEVRGKELRVGRAGDSAAVALAVGQGEALPVTVTYHHLGGRGGFVLRWAHGDSKPQPIPLLSFYFDRKLAVQWNYVVEPPPEEVDYTEFLKPSGAKHIVIYADSGHFAAWPANNGVWAWGQEILVGFTVGIYRKSAIHHSVDKTKPMRAVLARSLDGGETWAIEDPPHFVGDGDPPTQLTEPIDFSASGLAIRVHQDRFFVSYDRGHSWRRPFSIPALVPNKFTSRTDYVILGPRTCLFGFSAEEPRVQARLQDRAFCARTDDGGLSFRFVSWITDSVAVRSVMPSTVMFPDGRLVTALRRRIDRSFPDKPRLPQNWIDVYESIDGGATWRFLSKVAETDRGSDNGNPPSLVLLKDGRIVVTYGFRGVPYSIRARISTDGGKSWGREILLRRDALSWDMGYTRSVQRPDGKVVTVYYYTTEEIPQQHIAATIWDPDSLEKATK